MIERAPKLFLQILRNRLELVSLELQEEQLRLKRQIVLGTLGVALGFIGITGLGFLLVYLASPADRVLVASIIVAVLITSSIVLLVVARQFSRRHTPFEATLATLDKDIYDT